MNKNTLTGKKAVEAISIIEALSALGTVGEHSGGAEDALEDRDRLIGRARKLLREIA